MRGAASVLFTPRQRSSAGGSHGTTRVSSCKPKLLLTKRHRARRLCFGNAYISFVPVPWHGPATVASGTNRTLQLETPLKMQPNNGGADVKTDEDLWARLAVQAGPIVPNAFALQTDSTSRMRISWRLNRDSARGGQGGKHELLRRGPCRNSRVCRGSRFPRP